MSSSAERFPGTSLPRELVEEYLLGLADEAAAARVKGALEACPEALEAAQALRVEFDAVWRALDDTDAPEPGKDLFDLDLARYLDRALGDEETGLVEQILAESPAARRRLMALYREVRSVLDPAVQVELAPWHPEEPIPFPMRKNDLALDLQEEAKPGANAGEEGRRNASQ